MDEMIFLDTVFHRSKDRIRDYGEVFTPTNCVQEMLSTLENGKNFNWDDETIIFFEPCCGHGNIVAEILQKRLDAFYLKSIKNKTVRFATFYSVANSINTLWAIDIDEQNVNDCRSRVLEITFGFAKEKLKETNNKDLILSDKLFFAHLISAIYWQISNNEMLSALGNRSDIYNIFKLKSSEKWLLDNKQKVINFNKNWLDFYKRKISKGITPKVFIMAKKTINDYLDCSLKRSNFFEFIEVLNKEVFNKVKLDKLGMECESLWNQI